MEKFKYILTAIITLCSITTFAQPAQYTPMTAAGYQMKRLKVDSTLHLPSFCGVPTILGSTAKEGALAIDTCGGFLYMWTRTAGWDTVNTSGGGGSQDLQSVLNTGSTSINKDIDLYGKTTANEIYLSGMDNNFMPFMALGDSIGGGVYQYTYPRATIEFVNKYMSQKLKGQDSTRSEIYLPVQTIDGIDTLAKLSDVRAVSGGGGDFWKTSGTTNLTGTVTIANNGIVNFLGDDEDLQKFNVNALDVQFDGGFYKFTSMTSTTDTTLYKPLGIDADGKLAPLTSWVSGGSAGDDTTKVPYTGANKDVNIGTHDLYTNKVYLSDEPNGNYGSIHYTDGDFHVEDADNHKLLVIEDGFMQLHLSDTIQSNIFTTSLTQVRNHTLPDKSGTFALTSDTVSLSNRINLKLNATDTASLSNRINLKLNTADTSTLSNRINLKLNTADTSTLSNRINLKLNAADTSSLSNRINLKLNTADTTVFQRKSIQAYSFLANNTASTANAQALVFKDTSGTYTGTIAWNGTAPTGGNLSYRWIRIGKMVNINISLIYSTQGSSNSTLTVALPSDAPTPSKPAGLTSALNQLYPIVGSVNITNSSTLTNSATRGFLRNNTANNGFEFILNYAAATAANAYITCTYFTD